MKPETKLLGLEDFQKENAETFQDEVQRVDYNHRHYSISVYSDTEYNRSCRKKANIIEVMFYIINSENKYVFEVVTVKNIESALAIINGLELLREV